MASELAAAIDDRELLVEAELLVAYYLNEQHRTIDALRQVTDAIHVAESLLPDHPGSLLRAISTRALVRSSAGDYLGARADYHRVLSGVGDDVRAGLVAHLNISAMQIEVGRGKSALHHVSAAQEQLRLLKELPESSPRGASPDAIAYYESALALNEADAASRAAEHLLEQQRIDLVAPLLTQARAALARIPDDDQVGVWFAAYLGSMSEVARLEGDHVAAIDLARQSIDAAGRTNSTSAENYIHLAKAYEAAEHLDAAREAWRQAHAMVVRTRNSARTQHMLEALARVSERMGDLRAALDFTREALAESANQRALLDEMSEIDATAAALDGPGDMATWRDRLAMAERDATTDPLTGLLNRRGFNRAIETALQRPAPGRWVIALVDVDHFKAINDTHSHDTGDLVLQRIAQFLRSRPAPIGSYVGRYGGEEFAVALEVPLREDAAAFAMAMLDDARSELSVATAGMLSSRPSVTVSIGATPLDAEPLTEALRRADDALYEAKRSGRDRVCWRDGLG